MASREDRLPPYEGIMGGGAETPMETPAFFSDDPEVEARAWEAIEVGENGGICENCVHFVPPSTCEAFGGVLTVDPGRIVRCDEYRPTLGGAGSGLGAGGSFAPTY